jgi:riboflavin kinase/FMN adenylyltransferase
MNVFAGLEAVIPSSKGITLTIGNFDGVHRGHRVLLQRTLQVAKELNTLATVLTFEPHPMQVLYPDRPFKRIFDLEDLRSQLEELGVDSLILQPFTQKLANEDWRIFLHEQLLKRLPLVALVVGYDFAFGADRQGGAEQVQIECEKLGIRFEKLDPVELDQGVIFSSTEVRRAIHGGQMEYAKELLGREFYIEGQVIKGDQRGRTIGFPTANMVLPADSVVPSSGVYVTELCIGGCCYPAITNVGRAPTFEREEAHLRVETHVLQGEHSLYNLMVRIKFHKFIRPELKFTSSDELIKQIGKDILVSKDYFHGHD